MINTWTACLRMIFGEPTPRKSTWSQEKSGQPLVERGQKKQGAREMQIRIQCGLLLHCSPCLSLSKMEDTCRIHDCFDADVVAAGTSSTW
jgi:hypothetical protein